MEPPAGPLPLYPLFQDLRRSFFPIPAQAAMNIHVETPQHFLEAHVFNYERLVIVFEDARLAGARPDRYRQGWGVEPFLKRGVSVLAVKPKLCDWYANADLPEALDRMRPFLDRFPEIIHYGQSMGGFGALTYADLTGANRVLAFSPQSTYRLVDGRQDTRFPGALDFDHSGPFGDAVTGCTRPEEVWIVHDPYERTDRWHAERFTGANVRRVHLPFAGHPTGLILRNSGALGLMVDLALTGQLDRAGLYDLYRRRRGLVDYMTFLKIKARQHPNVHRRLLRILPEEMAGEAWAKALAGPPS